MDKSPETDAARFTRGGLLARNTYLNFLGQGVPLLVAVLAIPLLMGALGTERFGVLTIAWVVMGYFGLFDLGLGRATTKFVAEYQARSKVEALPGLVWSSVVVHVGLGLLGGSILALLTPLLVGSVLNVSGPLLWETKISFYLLALSVPLIVVTSALRGVLEAMQRFDLINLIKVPASIINYIGPLPVLLLVDSLAAVVGFLVFSRSVVLLVHLLFCLRVMPSLRSRARLDAGYVRPMLGFGGWLMISNFVTPSVVAVDRFVIGAVVSLSAVAYYATPYEMVTKLWLFSGSLLLVLFPAFAAMAASSGQEVRTLYGRAIRYLVVPVVPIVGVLLTFSEDLLTLWLGAEFASNSASVAKWLAIGVLINVLAQVPLTALQGVGRADVVAKTQLAQLPFYLAAVWFLAGSFGVSGVAAAWTLRAVVEAIILFGAARTLLPMTEDGGRGGSRVWLDVGIVAVFLILSLCGGFLLSGVLVLKIVVAIVLLGLFSLWEWGFLLQAADRKFLLGIVSPGLRGAQGGK